MSRQSRKERLRLIRRRKNDQLTCTCPIVIAIHCYKHKQKTKREMKDYHHLYIFGAATQRWFCFDLPYPIYVVLLSHLLSQLLGRLQTKHVVLGRDKEVKTKQLIGQRLVNLSAKHAGVDPKGREGRGGGRGGEVGGEGKGGGGEEGGGGGGGGKCGMLLSCYKVDILCNAMPHDKSTGTLPKSVSLHLTKQICVCHHLQAASSVLC